MYSDLQIRPRKVRSDDTVHVQVSVTNTGSMAADEVVQLYVSDKKASVEREKKALKGFRRVHIKPGKQVRVTFELTGKDMAFYDVMGRKWCTEPGEFDVLIGSSSRDIRLSGKFRLR